MSIKENFNRELNDFLNKAAHYESLLELMGETPPKDQEEVRIAKKMLKAFDAAIDILMDR